MPVRLIARENRLAVALAGLAQSRSRAQRIPEILTQRQRRDHRQRRYDSTKPQAVLSTVAAIGAGMSVTEAAGAATGGSGGYYGGAGGAGRDPL